MFLQKLYNIWIVKPESLYRLKRRNTVFVPAAAFLDCHLQFLPLPAAVFLKKSDLFFD